MSVLARLVAAVREEAVARLHKMLADGAAAAGPGLPGRLRGLLQGGEGQRCCRRELLRRPPTRTWGRAMAEALSRPPQVLAVGAGAADVATVPAGRLGLLARYGLAGKAPALRELAESRRTAVLLATVRAVEAAAVDDARDLFDVVMATRLISAVRRAAAADRRAALPRLERAARHPGRRGDHGPADQSGQADRLGRPVPPAR